MFLLDNVKAGGASIEEARFAADIWLIIPVAIFGLISVGITWIMKTAAIKHLDPTFVAIASPFSAVISGIISVITKTDSLTPRLIIGAVLIMTAAITSELFESKKHTEYRNLKTAAE